MFTQTIKTTLFCIILTFIFLIRGTIVHAQSQMLQTSKQLSPNEIPNKLFGLTIDESSLDEVALKMIA